jgi:hypothetical protein
MTTSQPTIQAPAAAPPETYPRWARWVTHAAVLPPLPSGIWRLAMAVGIPVGFSRDQLARGHVPGWGSLYLVGLSAVSEACALLTLGFIRPWGVVFPRWMPALGGRRVPPAVAIVPATLAALLLTFVSVQVCLATDKGFQADPEPGYPTGAAAFVMLATYLPLLVWGPLLAAATVGYWLRVRRLRTGTPPTA